MLMDMVVVTLVCWAVIGLIVFGRKYLLNLIPLFRDNEFHETEFSSRGNLVYEILKMRRKIITETSYKDVMKLVLIALIPIVNGFYCVFLFAWLLLLVISDITLAIVHGLKKFDFWDKTV